MKNLTKVHINTVFEGDDFDALEKLRHHFGILNYVGAVKEAVRKTAEGIAKENGCISGQAWALSFQSPEFFQNLGYDIFGVSDGYPDSIKEYFLIKRY